jgi:hypothetical protein
MSTQPAPGWYDDGTGRQRWWDGARWTEEFIDLREPHTELHTGAAPVGTGAAAAGWYDDQRGRQRWWDGARWTHFGDLSQPVGSVAASVDSGDSLLRTPAFTRTAVERRLVGAGGAITSRTMNRAIDRARLHLVVAGPEQVWITVVPPGEDAEARRFAAWVQASSAHYRFG